MRDPNNSSPSEEGMIFDAPKKRSVRENLQAIFTARIKAQVLFLLSAMFFVLPCSGQKRQTYIPPLEHYDLAIAAGEERDYSKALQILSQIDDQDSIYLSARVLETEILIKLKEYDKVIEICDSSIRNNSCYNYDFLLNKGISYLRLDENEEGVEVLGVMISLYPKSHLAWYNMGVGLLELNKFEEAIHAFKQSILCDPYYPSAHWQLGNLFLDEGLVSQAVLCYNTYLLLNPNRSNSSEILGIMDRALRAKVEAKSKGITISRNDSGFAEIDLIMQNFIGLNDDYVVSIPIELPFVKQQHCLMESLEKFRESDGFFGLYYVPFYKEMMAAGYFDSFIYRILSSNGNKNHQELIEKHYDNSTEFVQWIASTWKGLLNTRISSKGDTLVAGFMGSGEIESEWYKVDENPEYRKYKFYHQNGNVSTTGDQLDNKRAGLWSWWTESDFPREKSTYKKGAATGPHSTYFNNGQLKRKAFLKEGNYFGEKVEYNRYGAMVNRSWYIDDLRTDTTTIFYVYGEPFRKYSIPYREDKVHGTLFEYHPGGELKMEVSFEDGLKTGKEVHFFVNGNVSDYFPYEKGQLSGGSHSYYSDSTLKTVRLYKDDMAIGTWRSFRSDGSLESSTNYNELGELNGEYLEYGHNGEVLRKYEYEKGRMISMIHFNEKGEEFAGSGLDDENRLEYVFYTSDGILLTQGKYDSKGDQAGPWAYNNIYGHILSEEFYQNGKIHGVDKGYYPGGPISNETEYKNGISDGPVTDYYTDGKVSTTGWYVNGQREGRFREFYPDGGLSQSLYYFHDELQGNYDEYSASQKVVYRTVCDKGMKLETVMYDTAGVVIDTFKFLTDSVRIERFLNGEVRYRAHYKNGYSHGLVEKFYFDGTQAMKGSQFVGKYHGIWEWYDENGIVNARGEYSYGDRKGKWLDFDEDGQISRERFYKDGNLHGDYTSYSKPGVVKLRRNYEHGEPHGDASYYSDAGELQMVRIYEHGKIVAYTYPNSDGKLMPVIPIEKGTAQIICYYANGQISRQYGLLSGEFHGVYEEYFSDGILQSRDEYLYGNNTGVSVEYYPDGKLKDKSAYLLDELHGPVVAFYENGSKKSSHIFKNGSPVGKGYNFREDGSLEKTQTYFNGEIIHETIH